MNATHFFFCFPKSFSILSTRRPDQATLRTERKNYNLLDYSIRLSDNIIGLVLKFIGVEVQCIFIGSLLQSRFLLKAVAFSFQFCNLYFNAIFFQNILIFQLKNPYNYFKKNICVRSKSNLNKNASTEQLRQFLNSCQNLK